MSFEIVPGDPGSHVVLHVPHSSTHIPDNVRVGIVLDDEALAVELAAITDADTDLIASQAADAAAVRPWLFINRASRLVIDPERFPDDREEMNAVGMGAVYERTTTGAILRRPSDEQREELLSTYFHPYSDGLARLVRERLDALGEALIIDVHSFPREKLPYELHGDGERPEVCIGTDAVHTTNALGLRAQECFSDGGRSVALDTPFKGTYVPLFAYDAKDSRVQSVMVELRRDVVASDRSGLARSLGELIDRAETRNSFGCGQCYPVAVPESSYDYFTGLQRVALIEEDTHFRLSVLECKACGGRLASIFTELVDWYNGEDAHYTTIVPLTHAEAEHLLSASPGSSLYEWLGKRGEDRRHLIDDFPTGKPRRIGWRTGTFKVMPGY